MVRMQCAKVAHVREIGLGDEVDDAPIEIGLFAFEDDTEGFTSPGARAWEVVSTL